VKSRSVLFFGVYSFISRQVDQIGAGGFLILLGKAYTLLTLLITFLLIPLILTVRIVRPLILIRFGRLRSYRIGHFSANTEYYLCNKELSVHKRTFDLFYCIPPVCNIQLKKMYGRIINISRFNALLYRCNRMLPGYKDHEVPLGEWRDVNNLLERTKPHISFTNEEERRGRDALCGIGLSDSADFILFHARDSEYLDSFLTKRPRNHWRYHDYRDSNINNYLAAAEALAERGYYAFRMGAIVKGALDTANPKIVDYAIKYRTDFLDIYLLNKCKFFLGAFSGITNSAYDLFRKPIACVNTTHIEHMWTWHPNVLHIPKKHWLRDEHRFMTFHEIFESGVGRYMYARQYEEDGIELIENTPEEIESLAIEMDERLKGTWHTTYEDEELQKRFWDVFPKSELHGEIKSRIGSEFLRENRDMLY
jgi:putative glycosyltransferase (TIGR04372 family)